MYNPLVSIIIPVFNGSDYLTECIDSALAQTYKNIEIIVVNDGSNDSGATEKIALSYGDKIRYFRKENGGVATALNYGINKMKGDWFSWLSHDDLYLPNKIEYHIREINRNNLNPQNTILSCKAILVSSKGEKIFYPKKFDTGYFSGKEMFVRLFDGKALSGCALLIPRISLLNIGGFDAKYKFIQDWVCWVELSLANNSFYLHNDELVKTRIHENQDSKRLADLQPKEVSSYLSCLLERMKHDVPNNSFFMKTILFKYCTTKNNSYTSEQFYNQLKSSGNFNWTSQIIYKLFQLRGYLVKLLKRMFRAVITRLYRGEK